MSVLSKDEKHEMKEQIVKELTTPKVRLLLVLQHPLILLIAGFIMTGVIGAQLSEYWKTKEWENQQKYLHKEKQLQRQNERAYLEDQQLLQQQRDLMNELVEAVASTLAPASDLTTVVKYGWDIKERAKEIEEREGYWRNGSRAWREKSTVIAAKLAVIYGEPEAERVFQTIINKRRQLGVDVRNLLEDLKRKKSGKAGEDTVERAEKINDLVNVIKAELSTLYRLLGGQMVDNVSRAQS